MLWRYSLKMAPFLYHLTPALYYSVGGVKVSIVAFQAIDPGSIPGWRKIFYIKNNYLKYTFALCYCQYFNAKDCTGIWNMFVNSIHHKYLLTELIKIKQGALVACPCDTNSELWIWESESRGSLTHRHLVTAKKINYIRYTSAFARGWLQRRWCKG